MITPPEIPPTSQIPENSVKDRVNNKSTKTETRCVCVDTKKHPWDGCLLKWQEELKTLLGGKELADFLNSGESRTCSPSSHSCANADLTDELGEL